MNFIQPAIDPVIFSIGIIDIRWYSLAYIFGILFGTLFFSETISSNMLLGTIIIIVSGVALIKYSKFN